MNAPKRCWTCSTAPAHPGFMTCENCERHAETLRQTPGTLAYAIAHLHDSRCA